MLRSGERFQDCFLITIVCLPGHACPGGAAHTSPPSRSAGPGMNGVRRAFARRLEGGAIMDAKSFRGLFAGLGSLTGPQLKELWTALRSLDARMQAIGATEKRREGAVACPHCSHDRSTRWGSTQTGVQRMRCPSCRRTFSSSTGTAVAGIHSPARFHQVVADMFCDHPCSCRGLGRALGLDKMTIWRWRQKIIRALGGSAPPTSAAWSKRTRNSSGNPARARASGSSISAIRSIIRSRIGCAGWTTNARERSRIVFEQRQLGRLPLVP